MNILVIAHYGLYEDYSFSFIHAQAQAYAAKGHRVRAVVPVAWGKYCNGTGDRFGAPCRIHVVDGVEVVHLRVVSFSNLGERRNWNIPWAIRALRQNAAKILDGFQPDVIHAHTLGLDSEMGAWMKAKCGCPMVLTTHGSDTTVPYRAGQQDTLKAYGEKADHIVAVSSNLQRTLLSCGIDKPVDVILNGFHVGNVREGMDKVPCSWLQVGHLIKQKQTHVTLDAFAKFHTQYPQARLTVIGRGPEREALEQQTADLGLEDAVRFLGQIPNGQVLEEMAKAQFYVMPSVREGFGIVYLEAMASSCITLGTQGEGIADLIQSGRNGLLAPAEDAGAVAEMIVRCMERPEWAAELAKQGKTDALELSWEANAEKYLNLFEDLKNPKKERV